MKVHGDVRLKGEGDGSPGNKGCGSVGMMWLNRGNDISSIGVSRESTKKIC